MRKTILLAQRLSINYKSIYCPGGTIKYNTLRVTSGRCARARKSQRRMCMPSHHTFARMQIGLAPTAVDRGARSTCTPASVGLAYRQRLPGLPRPRGESMLVRSLGQAYLIHDALRCSSLSVNVGESLSLCLSLSVGVPHSCLLLADAPQREPWPPGLLRLRAVLLSLSLSLSFGSGLQR